jgi:predicted ATPase
MRRALVIWRSAGAATWAPYGLSLLAEAYGKAGQSAEGEQVVLEALGLIDKTGERHWKAELRRLKGELLLSRSSDH